jgi:hypothetical protein
VWKPKPIGKATLTAPWNLRGCRLPPAPAAASSLLIVPYALLAFAQALRDRGSSWDQRGLIREALREVGVILLHDVEHRFLGEPAMVLGKESVQVSELFVVHRHRASVAIPRTYRKLLITRQLSTRLIVFRKRSQVLIVAVARLHRRLAARAVNRLLTMSA